MVESDCYTQVNDNLSGWIANRAPNAALRKMALRVVKHSTPEQWVKYFWWDALCLDTDTCLDMSQTLRDIDADFPIKAIGVTRIAPNTVYPLHKDTNRGCGINMMLSDCNLHSTESFCAWVDHESTVQLQYEQDTKVIWSIMDQLIRGCFGHTTGLLYTRSWKQCLTQWASTHHSSLI